MAVPCELLLHPELLSNEQLIQIIKERYLRVENLRNMRRDELLDLFHQYCLPYGQRKYRDSGRGRVLNKGRDPSPEPVTLSTFNNNKINRKTLHSDCERLKPPPDALSGQMKRIKLTNNVAVDNKNNKRKMSIDGLLSDITNTTENQSYDNINTFFVAEGKYSYRMSSS